jgi:hypothetical protein
MESTLRNLNLAKNILPMRRIVKSTIWAVEIKSEGCMWLAVQVGVRQEEAITSVRYEVLGVVTMKNTVLWVVKSFSSEKARRFEEHLASIFRTEA